MNVLFVHVITGPPTHSVGGRLVTVASVVCRLSSSVTWHICNVTHQGAARGGPVVLRPLRATVATPCLFNIAMYVVVCFYCCFNEDENDYTKTKLYD